MWGRQPRRQHQDISEMRQCSPQKAQWLNASGTEVMLNILQSCNTCGGYLDTTKTLLLLASMDAEQSQLIALAWLWVPYRGICSRFAVWSGSHPPLPSPTCAATQVPERARKRGAAAAARHRQALAAARRALLPRLLQLVTAHHRPQLPSSRPRQHLAASRSSQQQHLPRLLLGTAAAAPVLLPLAMLAAAAAVAAGLSAAVAAAAGLPAAVGAPVQPLQHLAPTVPIQWSLAMAQARQGGREQRSSGRTLSLSWPVLRTSKSEDFFPPGCGAVVTCCPVVHSSMQA